MLVATDDDELSDLLDRFGGGLRGLSDDLLNNNFVVNARFVLDTSATIEKPVAYTAQLMSIIAALDTNNVIMELLLMIL